ncbi:hypothetical protein vBBaMIFTN7_68 [Bordetella phage vB_BaM-IFTN7]|nr:hypothetical protein vBBaMIFTN7_68 [Bordetella phage vB_BaM-IFTN7]
MAEILRHVTRGLPQSESAQEATRRGVRRVLDHLVGSGQVMREGGNTKGASYSWARKSGQMSQLGPNLGRQMGQYGRGHAP